jgi:hypothetical protein
MSCGPRLNTSLGVLLIMNRVVCDRIDPTWSTGRSVPQHMQKPEKHTEHQLISYRRRMIRMDQVSPVHTPRVEAHYTDVADRSTLISSSGSQDQLTKTLDRKV